VVLVRTDVSEERIASIIRVRRIGELRTLAVTSELATSQKTAFFIVTAEDLKSYMIEDVVIIRKRDVCTRDGK
jgi:hypothetical protein